MEQVERETIGAAVLPEAVAAGVATGHTVSAQGCPSCGGAHAKAGDTPAAPPAWIYALGSIEPRFPKISIEKEFAQVLGREKMQGATDRQALQAVISKNRYLARQMCWVMTIGGLETYILMPRDPMDIDLLAETLRASPKPGDLDCVIGIRGPMAPPDMCNGLMIPMVAFDQIYSFDRDSLIKSIPQPKKTPAQEFTAAAEELFDRVMQMTDNAGATDEHRALNYLAVRYPRIYEMTADAFGRNESLTGVEVRASVLGGARKVVDAIFAFTNRTTDVVSKQFVRVDVSDEFPFLVTKLSPYLDR